MKPTPEMLEVLGITREDVLNCVVKELAKEILGLDEDGEYEVRNLDSRVMSQVCKFIDAKIVEQVASQCETAFTPLIESKLADYTFQQTNTWGEKTGETLTFTEYLVKQINGYMLEEVDRRGRNNAECRRNHDTFYSSGTRITFAIQEYFQTAMESAMKEILADSARILTEGIEKAAKDALGDIHKRLTAKISVN